ncbi:VOC family protein [Paracrocinitomix mangrovi]|uniref:VOC family protein n=1 Tax=Paracrocinitomix mangrovi TaxID=2862509 RepID=UPI001C8E3F8D|nr:VOC family protein [Paracrocinitomix mangrovi]UKN00598.1 VOC family protein [Paracrocinitomix mangrovi]
MNLTPFHVAIPVRNLKEAYDFYIKCFNCDTGRTSDHWIDLNFYGHQFVLHLKEGMQIENHHNAVDGKAVPVPHYGVVLDWDVWQQLADHLKSLQIEFVIEPYIRFEGQVGEQATMFLLDPSGNALEFKSFKNIDQLFAK